MTEVLIAEESVLLREGLAAVLRQEGMSVVARVENAAALRTAIATRTPDVALVGIPLPAVGQDRGLYAIELLKRDYPDAGVLVLSGSFDPAFARGLISCRPASVGYLLKQPLPDIATLVRAVRVVAGGGTFVDRAMIERLRSVYSRRESLSCLSEREREILALMAEGRTNRAICHALCLSTKTVETHVRAVFKKLDLRAAADDHRRVLAVLRYLQADTNGQGRIRTSGCADAARPA